MYVKIKDFIGGRLRGLCDRLTPRQRAIAVIVMASLFALVNFYMIFRAVYDIGREDGRFMTSGGRTFGRTSSGLLRLRFPTLCRRIPFPT